MTILRLIFLLGLCIFNSHSSKPPPYIKPCSLSDPDLNECCVRHAKEALPFLLKGDKEFNIPKFSPLFLPRLSLDSGKDLHVTMTDINAYGLERIDIKQINFNVEEMKVSLKLAVDNLQIVGKYEMDGTILVLPIQGKGDFNLTAIDGVYTYDFDFSLKKDGDHSYVVISDNDKLNFELGNAIIKLENLFNGDKMLGKLTNDVLNENWRDVLNEIGGALSETVRSISKAILTGLTSKIPYEELFLK